MNKNIKLIVMDIDGTIVDDQRMLSQSNREVLDRLMHSDYLVGIASGRSIDELITMKDIWGLAKSFDIIIGMNGAQLWDELNQKRYDFYQLKPEWIKEILDIMRPFDLNPYMIKGRMLMCLRNDEEIVKSSKRNETAIHVVEDETEFYHEPCPKIMFKIPQDKIDDILTYAMSHKKSPYTAFKTQPVMLEFADERTNKINALRKYAENNGIDLKDIMSFGDMTNDNEMIRQVGWGVAMANGAEDTKRAARFITKYDNNHDGFSRFILEEFRLI